MPSRRKYLTVGLCPELDPADVAYARHLPGIAGLDDHALELFNIDETAAELDRVLEIHVGRRGRHADLSGGDLLALPLQRLDDVGGVETARLQFFRVEPNSRRILAGAEQLDLADAGQPRQLVDQIDRCVVGEIEIVEAFVGRRQRDEQQDRRRALLHRDALNLHRLGQRRQSARHAVLHQDLRGIEIGADRKGYGEAVAAVARIRRLHVDHILDAVDLLLDRQRHGVHERAGAGSGIAGRHLNGRRDDVGILGDRQAVERDSADQNHQDRDDVREDRTLDEEF